MLGAERHSPPPTSSVAATAGAPEHGARALSSAMGRPLRPSTAERRPAPLPSGSQSARQHQPAPDRVPAVSSKPTALAAEACGKRYDPETDFALARGDEDGAVLLPELALFFLSELASLHSAVGEDGLAMQLLWKARSFADALPSGHPDAAIVWCGLGRVAFLAGKPDIAARALSRARRIREKTIGGDTMETATTYNNLACCFHELQRPAEALALLELGAEILRTLAGDDHPRAATALRNLARARSSDKQHHTEVPNLFRIPVRDLVGRPRSKGRKKKKGSSGGSSKGSSRGSRKSTSSKGSKASRKSGRKSTTRKSVR